MPPSWVCNFLGSMPHEGVCRFVVCVYMSAGVGRLNVAYPFLGAMRRPDLRDRRGEIQTPTSFFVSISLAV